MPAPSLKRPRRSVVMTAVIALVIGIPTAVIAAHDFDDVPDDHLFHQDIDWLFDNNVTTGCNPSSGGNLFCPDLEVDRGQMAAFMRRLAGTFGADGSQVTGTGDPITVSSTDRVELLSVSVTPEDEATVTLDAHVQIEVETGADGQFEVVIARDSCAGDIVGAGAWRIQQDTGALPSNTISVTGFDVVSADSTYHLCAEKGAPGSLDGTALRRGLTATWAPTS